MALQMLCVLLFASQSLAASTAGRKWCSGDLLRGFLDKGEEGCCIPEGLCHDPVQARVLAEQLEHIGKPTSRRKRSLDTSGYQLREHLLSKQESTTEKQEESQTLLGPFVFQEKASQKQMTCPAGCSKGKMDICEVETKLSFPVFGTSVTKKTKVHIIQAEPMFDQPVVRRVCKQKKCALLQGKCNQVYQPQLMFVDPGTLGVARMDLDYVYVESGCECSVEMSPASDSSDSSMDTSEMNDSLEISDEQINLVGAGAEPEVEAEKDSEDESPIHTPAPEPTPEPEAEVVTTHAAAPVEDHEVHVEIVPTAPAPTPEEHEMVAIVETTTPVPHSMDDVQDHDPAEHAEEGTFTMAAANLEGSEEVGSSTTTIHP